MHPVVSPPAVPGAGVGLLNLDILEGSTSGSESESSGSKIGSDVFDDLGTHSSSDSDVVDEDLKSKLRRAHVKVRVLVGGALA